MRHLYCAPTRRPRVHHRVNLYPGARRQSQNRTAFRSRQNESVNHSSFSSVSNLFHARGAATEKALSPIRRRVRGTTRLPRGCCCKKSRCPEIKTVSDDHLWSLDIKTVSARVSRVCLDADPRLVESEIQSCYSEACCT